MCVHICTCPFIQCHISVHICMYCILRITKCVGYLPLYVGATLVECTPIVTYTQRNVHNHHLHKRGVNEPHLYTREMYTIVTCTREM